VLLTAILVSFRAHVLQIHTAKKRLVAIETADRLLTRWTAHGTFPQVGQQEEIANQDGMFWRIIEQNTFGESSFSLRVIRLEICKLGSDQKIEVLATVEVADSISEQRQ